MKHTGRLAAAVTAVTLSLLIVNTADSAEAAGSCARPGTLFCEDFERLAGSSVAVRYLRFRHEGHGFRDAAVVAGCLRAELELYSEAFGFDLPAPGADGLR